MLLSYAVLLTSSIGGVLGGVAVKCPHELYTPFCYYDKSRPEFACALPDKLVYTNSTRHDYLSYACPPSLYPDGGKPEAMQLVASGGTYKADYAAKEAHDEWTDGTSMTAHIKKLFGDWETFSMQLRLRENPVYSLRQPYMRVLDKQAFIGLDMNTWAGLYFSGSRQFGVADFSILNRHFYESLAHESCPVPAPAVKVVIVDLRQESHFFLNGLPVYLRCPHNWANGALYPTDPSLPPADRRAAHRAADDKMARDELLRIRHLETCSGDVRFLDSKHDVAPTASKRISELVTEADLVSNINTALPGALFNASRLRTFEYLRIRAPDHGAPSEDTINDFVGALLLHHRAALASDITPWFHFHCNAGRGRSAYFLALYDILANAYSTPLDVILARQRVLSDYNKLGRLYAPAEIGTMEGEDPVEQVELNKRTATLALFYEYARSLGPVLRTGQPAPAPFALPPDFQHQFQVLEKQAKKAATADALSLPLTLTLILAAALF